MKKHIDYSEDLPIEKIIIILIILLILFHFIDNITWNNGICPCGGHYQHIHSSSIGDVDYYIYKCDKCNRKITTIEYYVPN